MEIYHTIVGLPRSGKTTFLAATWHLIDAGEISTGLVLEKLVGDHQHLNTIVEAWRRCEEVPRTSMAAETSVSIHVREPATGRSAVLAFPDLSGESFERQVVMRTCRSAYVQGLEGEGGILLFVTADRGQDGLTVLDIASVLDGDTSSEEPGSIRKWTPDLIPEQVRLVELLQFLQRPPFRRGRRKLAVIVSAWDVLPEPSPSPEQWLCRELPFMHQFLATNSSSFESRVYGVSAQGGNVRSGDREVLARMIPSERIKCVGPDVANHDLTSPILWLMDET
jgi:hypothetical protein